MCALCIYFLPTSHDILWDVVIFNEYKKSIYCLNTSSLNIMTLLRKLIDLTSPPSVCKSIYIMFTVVFWEYMIVLTLPAFFGKHLSLYLQFLIFIASWKTDFNFNQIKIHKLKNDSQNFNACMHVSFLIIYSSYVYG